MTACMNFLLQLPQICEFYGECYPNRRNNLEQVIGILNMGYHIRYSHEKQKLSPKENHLKAKFLQGEWETEEERGGGKAGF